MADNTNITVNMENLNDTERAQLLALIEKANKPKDGVWKPEQKEAYYYIQYSTSDIIPSKNDNMYLDNDRFAIGNYFRTKKEAEFAVERLKVMEELRVLANGFKPGTTNIWYSVCYSANEKKIMVNEYWSTIVGSRIYFPSREAAQNAIDTIGADRLKKYYFCIED